MKWSAVRPTIRRISMSGLRRLSCGVWSGCTIGSRTPKAKTAGIVSLGRSSTNVAAPMQFVRFLLMMSQCAGRSPVRMNPFAKSSRRPDASE